ncbi:MAG: NADH-quinone oxidoreductase subunit H [Candidatus Aenigmarchaeota archaeon]|nr:NADH-quinone oxidoreductase subunit H [Candidatus Aenigmarchaeota archaeon]
MTLVIFGALNIIAVLLLSPLFMTIIKKAKAYAQRRKGPPLLQGYYTFLKLLRKEVVYSRNSSWIMRVTPYINMAAMLVATLFVPIAFIPEPTGYGNIILFLYMLALPKFFMALSGLDAGSTFGGMGSSREMTISSVIEPIMVLVFAALVFSLKTLDITEMFSVAAGSGILEINTALLPLSIAMFIMLITETARIPVDNPETHLELTMVHEAMILEQSGRNLALMELSHAVKQTLLMAFLINIFMPWGIATALDAAGVAISIASFALKGALLAAVIGIFESSMAKSRLFRLPAVFALAFFLSLLTMLLTVFK